ncbi:MAG: sigma-70 family RNA polymerase sigma factor, partial [Acidimicrobiales bacterium]
MDPRQLDTPHRRSTRATEIAHHWSRYQATGDERIHAELLRSVDQFIRLEARRLLARHGPLAEEACQEALLGVERKIATMDPPDHPAAYIRKVLDNRAATLLQREARRRAREEAYWSPEVDDVDVSATSEWHDFLESLRKAVNDDEFWTLVLHYHFDFSYIEIGELLEKEPGAIRQIALRGRRKCRERMGRLEGRIPAWVTFTEPQWQPGWREPASDSVDGPRRPSAGSDSTGVARNG